MEISDLGFQISDLRTERLDQLTKSTNSHTHLTLLLFNSIQVLFGADEEALSPAAYEASVRSLKPVSAIFEKVLPGLMTMAGPSSLWT